MAVVEFCMARGASLVKAYQRQLEDTTDNQASLHIPFIA